jgi:HTH-type transcriptional regulator/antitoxin HigA
MKSLLEIRGNLKPIKTKEQYKEYLSIIDTLIDCEENTPEEEVLELISILIEDYEIKYHFVEAPDPIEAIKIKMEEDHLRKKDLVQYFGSPSRVSEILNRKRTLTLDMMKKLHRGLGISAETLLSV